MGRVYPQLTTDAEGNPVVRDMNRAWVNLILEPADHDALQELAAQDGLTGRGLLERELKRVIEPLIKGWPQRKRQLEAAGQLKTTKAAKAAPANLTPEQLREREAKERERQEKKEQREAAAKARATQQAAALEARRQKLLEEAKAQQQAAAERQQAAKQEAEARARAQANQPQSTPAAR